MTGSTAEKFIYLPNRKKMMIKLMQSVLEIIKKSKVTKTGKLTSTKN